MMAIERHSAAFWVVLATLVVLAALQVLLQLSFWADLAGGDLSRAWLFQGIGAGFTLLELFLLVVSSELVADEQYAKAYWLRGLFAVIACVNLSADLSAVSKFTGADQVRHDQAAADESRRATFNSAQAVLLADYRRQLKIKGMNRPIDALRIERDALKVSAGRYGREATPPRLLSQIAALDSAIAVANEADKIEAGLNAQPAAKQNIPGSFDGLIELAQIVGLDATGESVRATLALAVALALKLALTVGFWALASRIGAFAAVGSDRRAVGTGATKGDAPSARAKLPQPPTKSAAGQSPATTESVIALFDQVRSP